MDENGQRGYERVADSGPVAGRNASRTDLGTWASMIQLDALRGRTGLPLEQARSALADYDVRSVIPVTGRRAWQEYLLAVTSEGLAILTPHRDRHRHVRDFATKLMPWSRVRLGARSAVCEDESTFDVVVRVGRKTFIALLDGNDGQRTLREFVVAAQHGIRGDFKYIDYDAASVLAR